MIPITIITCTAGRRPNLLKRCINSINSAKSDIDKHLIIETQEYIKSKKEIMNIPGFIAFVDDDDYISENAISLCRGALEKYNVGACFTYERVQSEPSSEFIYNDYTNVGAKNYNEICLSPGGIHHLVVFNMKHCHPDCFKLQDKFSCGIDWLLKASAAVTGGCIKIPEIGYYWNQHNVQETKSDFQTKMSIAQPDINLFLESISKFRLNERIKEFKKE
jgi:hypothetical protein